MQNCVTGKGCLVSVTWGFALLDSQIKVPIAASCKGVCLQNTSKSHTYHLKNMAIIMTLWIGNSAVLKSSSQWQLKEFRK